MASYCAPFNSDSLEVLRQRILAGVDSKRKASAHHYDPMELTRLLDYITANCSVVMDAADFVRAWREDNGINFIADTVSGLYYVNWLRGAHESAMRLLYEAYSGDYSKVTSDAADGFVYHYGAFKSSVSTRVYVGRGVSLPVEVALALRRDMETL